MANKITFLEGVRLAHHAYRDRSAYSNYLDLPSEWSVYKDVDPSKGSATGYFGSCYLKGDPPTQIVFAHRGTEITDILDLLQDSKLIFGDMSGQYDTAKEFYDSTLEELKSKYPSISEIENLITHTGHSLGALLAELMCAVSKTDGMTFDSPGSKEAAINMFKLDETQLAEIKERCLIVQSHWNVINTAKEQIGKIHLLDTPLFQNVSLLTGIIPGVKDLPVAYPLYETLQYTSSDNWLTNLLPEWIKELGKIFNVATTDFYYTLTYSIGQHSIEFIHDTLEFRIQPEEQEFWPIGVEEGYKHYRRYDTPVGWAYWGRYIEKVWDTWPYVKFVFQNDYRKFKEYFVDRYLFEKGENDPKWNKSK